MKPVAIIVGILLLFIGLILMVETSARPKVVVWTQSGRAAVEEFPPMHKFRRIDVNKTPSNGVVVIEFVLDEDKK